MLPFDEMRDPATGRPRVRTVDIGSESYRVAREYMIRLERRDLEDGDMLRKLAQEAMMTPDAFASRFAWVVELDGSKP